MIHIPCSTCGATNNRFRKTPLSNGGSHLQIICNGCGKHIKNASEEQRKTIPKELIEHVKPKQTPKDRPTLF